MNNELDEVITNTVLGGRTVTISRAANGEHIIVESHGIRAIGLSVLTALEEHESIRRKQDEHEALRVSEASVAAEIATDD